MTQSLKLWNCRWAVDESRGLYAMLRNPPTPEILSYWITGQSINDDYCTYVGIIAAVNETAALQILMHNVQPILEVSWIRPIKVNLGMGYNPDLHVFDWPSQRLIYQTSTGRVMDRPLVSHDEDGWSCITFTEFL